MKLSLAITGNEDEGPNKMNSNFVIQFLAQPVTGNFAPRDKKATIRDGTSQSTNNHQAPRRKLLKIIVYTKIVIPNL